MLSQSVNNANAQTRKPQGPPAPTHQTQPSELSAIKDGIERIAREQDAERDQRKADKAKADNYAKRSLEAQEAMAKSAKSTYSTTLMSITLSFFALLALLYSLYLNRRATNAAQDAVLVARETNEAQSRAWISVNCMLGRPERGKTQAGIAGIYFNVVCAGKNHGRSPATSVSFHAEIALLGPRYPSMEERMNGYCEALRKWDKHEAEAIFPEEDFEFNHMVFLSNADIDSDIAENDFKIIKPIVYGCLNYKSPYTKGVRQTRFAYHIVSVNEKRQAIALMPNKPNWPDIPIVLAAPGQIVAD